MLCSTSWDIERWENLKPQQLTKKFRKPNLLRFLREIGLRFLLNASRALLKKHHRFFRDLVVTKKNIFRNRIYLDLIYGLFLSGDTKSEENENVNAKFKTNLLRAGIEPAT